MTNDEQLPPGSESAIFTPDGYISGTGKHSLLEGESSDLEYQAMQFFLEESYLTLTTVMTDHEVDDAFASGRAILGPKGTSYVLECHEDDLGLLLEHSTAKWKQSAAKKLVLIKNWVSTNAILSHPEMLGDGEEYDSVSSYELALRTLIAPYPELDDEKSVLFFLQTRPPSVDAVEDMYSALWHNYNGRQ